MSTVVRPYWLAVVFGLTSLVQAQSHHSHIVLAAHGGGHGHPGSMGGSPGVFVGGGSPGHYIGGSGYSHFYGIGGGYGYGLGYGGYGYGYSYPLIANYGGGVPVLWPIFAPQTFNGGGFGGGGGGLRLPMPPPQLAQNVPGNAAPHVRNTNRSKELVEIGDRSFRGGNIKRAQDKYVLAAKSDPKSPTPHVHMAQVSLARGDYVAAADHLRDAVTIAPDGGWLLTAPDIQAIFAEPADFAKHLARLESHLQANPTDRDAWFVLGAECYLSGRTKQAADVFERLSDRKPDEALSAFMDASKTKVPAAN